MIPYGHQDIRQEDIDAVVTVLKSELITQGAVVPRFENAVAEKFGARFGVAVNSGTSALHVACLALGLKKGDLLWTVPNTFVASANCGRYCGADVDFVDIDQFSWNMSVPKLEEKLIDAKRKRCLPKVIVPVHFAGQPTDQEVIRELSDDYGFFVLEDASHSIGAKRNDEPVGSCRWSDITIFSFHPVKNITTGEGGMAMTNDPVLAEKMELLRSHGITRNCNRFEYPSPGPWYYEQQELGFNYRMTDIQAALGMSQLLRLDEYVEKRNNLAKQYNNELHNLPIQHQRIKPENLSAFHLYVIRLKDGEIKMNRREVFEEMRRGGIGVNLHYIPVHLQPYYQKLGFLEGDFAEAEKYASEAITLPLYPGLTRDEQIKVITTLKKAI